jgi:hypothetical protein
MWLFIEFVRSAVPNSLDVTTMMVSPVREQHLARSPGKPLF